MRQQLTKIFEDVADGVITPDEAYYKFINMKQDLYSILATECGLIEKGVNVWVKEKPLVKDNDFIKTTYHLTKHGFHQKIEYKKPERKSFIQMLFGS